MYAKIAITGIIESLSGMHIGGSSEFSAIGSVDSPVMRDVLSGEPMIPGSSLKGKMRTLLSRQYNSGKLPQEHHRDNIKVLRLFGDSKSSEYKTARLIFSDSMVQNGEELKNKGISTTEVKFENTINRLTAVANPRQIERSVRGLKYSLSIIYNVQDGISLEEIKEDFNTIKQGCKLIEFDYLGENGTRGYGKVKFDKLNAECVVGEVTDELLTECNNILSEGKWIIQYLN